MQRGKILKLFYKAGLARVLRSRKANTLTVLSLHRVSPNRDYFFNPISPNHFEILLRYVFKYYNVISFSDIPIVHHAKKTNNKPYLILSFDDGYYDFIEYALPFLDKYKLSSNHNVVNNCANKNENIWTQRLNFIFNFCRDKQFDLVFELPGKGTWRLSNFLGHWMQFYLAVFRTMLELPKDVRLGILAVKENEMGIRSDYRMMNWAEVQECMRHRVEIGSHTYSHDVLSTIHDPEILRFEILQSKLEIEQHIHKPVNILALPNGQTNKSIDKFSREGGYSYVLHVEDKVNPWDKELMTADKPIYRIGMIDESPEEMFLRTELFHAKLKRSA